MSSLGKPISQRQLRVGEMIKQAIGMLFIRDEAKIPSFSTINIYFLDFDGVRNFITRGHAERRPSL